MTEPPATEGLAAGLAEFVLVPEALKDACMAFNKFNHTPAGVPWDFEREAIEVAIRAYLAAAPSPANSGETGKPPVYTDAEKEALLALAYHKMNGGLDFTSSHAKIILGLLERFTRQYFPPLDAMSRMVTEAMVDAALVVLYGGYWADYLTVHEQRGRRETVCEALEAALSVPAAEQKAEPVHRVAWLIERKGFAGDPRPHWYWEDTRGNHAWTPEATAALPFASEAEARAFPSYRMISRDPEISITEHAFINSAPLTTQAIEARNAVIEALRPFAAEADRISPEWADERRRSTLTDSKALTVGDFRRARAALRAAEARQL